MSIMSFSSVPAGAFQRYALADSQFSQFYIALGSCSLALRLSCRKRLSRFCKALRFHINSCVSHSARLMNLYFSNRVLFCCKW